MFTDRLSPHVRGAPGGGREPHREEREAVAAGPERGAWVVIAAPEGTAPGCRRHGATSKQTYQQTWSKHIKEPELHGASQNWYKTRPAGQVRTFGRDLPGQAVIGGLPTG